MENVWVKELKTNIKPSLPRHENFGDKYEGGRYGKSSDPERPVHINMNDGRNHHGGGSDLQVELV